MTETQELIQGILEHADWEGGMDEILLTMDGLSQIKSLGNQALTNKARNFIAAWETFDNEWKEFCKKNNNTEPYL